MTKKAKRILGIGTTADIDLARLIGTKEIAKYEFPMPLTEDQRKVAEATSAAITLLMQHVAGELPLGVICHIFAYNIATAGLHSGIKMLEKAGALGSAVEAINKTLLFAEAAEAAKTQDPNLKAVH